MTSSVPVSGRHVPIRSHAIVHPVLSLAGAAPDAAEAYRRWSTPVLGYLRAQGAADPSDLLGEVFYCVARDLPRIAGDEAAIRRWIFTVARNRLIDDRRRRARRPRTCGDPAPDVPAPEQVADAIDPTLIAALRQLTPRQREVVVLRFVTDLSLGEVARITRRPVGAVKALQRRGLIHLRGLLTPPS